MADRSVWWRIVAAVASGLLVAGLFPPFRAGVLVWVALVPLLLALWSLDGKRAAWKGFALGWLAGVVSCLVQFRWLAVVSTLGVVVLPLYLGLFWGIFGAFAAGIGHPWRNGAGNGTSVRAEVMGSLGVAFRTGAVWAGLEWLRSWLFTGFGWNPLGVAFHETPLVAQAADLLGVAGLSLLPVFFQAVLVQTGRRVRQGAREGRMRTRLDFVVAAGVVAIVAAYGAIRLATERAGDSIRLRALLVQLNIPQEAARPLWDALDIHMAYEEETGKALEALKAAAGKEPWPDWVMWPETALTGRILRTGDGAWGTWQENINTVAQVRKAGPFHLIYGVNELEAEATPDGQLAMKENGRAWNSLAVMSPEDKLQTYRKHHLVIFGETIPFVDRIPLLQRIYEQQAGVKYGGSFSPGESFDPLAIPTLKGAEIGAVPTICFEDSVPRLVRRFVRPGPQVIVNVTNDGWFKESAAAAQHFANARFRAIELRRPMLRCANTGVSAALDSTGSTAHPDSGKPQVLTDARGSHFTRGSLLVELDVPKQPSFSLYAWMGDWGVIALGIGAWIAAWRSQRARKLGDAV